LNLNFKDKSAQGGFSLIELVIVIVILGILAATALPKFTDLSDDAEKVVFESFGAALISAANMAHLKQVGTGLGPSDPIDVSGVSIDMEKGYPTDISIEHLVVIRGFILQEGGKGWFFWGKSGSEECMVDYNYAGWVANPTLDRPYIKIFRSGC